MEFIGVGVELIDLAKSSGIVGQKTTTPTTRHTRDSLETYRSSLRTPEYQGAQRVL